MCDVCAAHGDGAAVGVDVDAQGSSLRESFIQVLSVFTPCRLFIYHFFFFYYIFFSILTDNFVETAQFGDRNVLLLLLMIFLYVPES